MAPKNRRAGVIEFQMNGKVFDAVGAFTCNYGAPKREGLVGPTGVQGYSENPQVAKISGEIRDAQDLNIEDILYFVDGVATITFANGKTFMLEQAYYCGDGDLDTGEGKIQLELEGQSADEIPA